MARASRTCTQPGCPNLQPCPEHKPKPWANSKRRHQLPPNWTAIRQAALHRDGHTCVHPNCTAPATDVDHIGNPHDHTLTNLRSLCHPHHEEHTKAQAAEARRASGMYRR